MANAQQSFTWGVWMTSSEPFKGKAHGAMTEETFRKLMGGLLEVMGGNFDRALDRLKQIMLAELDRIRTDHDAARVMAERHDGKDGKNGSA